MGALIWREMNLKLALQVAAAKVLFASDPHAGCANFYRGPFSTSEVDDGELSLAFSWDGPVSVSHDTGASSLASGVLWDISTNDSGPYDPTSYWVTRIYPETVSGLQLIGVVYRRNLSTRLSISKRLDIARLNDHIATYPSISVLKLSPERI